MAYIPVHPRLPSRRSLLGSALALAGALALAAPEDASAQDFPERPLSVTIPTGEGGGADRDARTFESVWRNHLGQGVEYEYYPGAAGQVGYEFYMQKEPNAYNLLFANLGPEVIMLELQDVPVEVGEDIVYIQQTSSEPMAIYVAADSPFQTLQDLVDEAKERTVTVAVSRLPHPASIGVLALGEATGADFRLIPYGGGNPSSMATITQETDAGALPFANPIALGEQVRTLGVFAPKNPAPEMSGNAPTVNDALGLDLPHFTSSRAWGVHREAYDAHPERIEKLKETMRATLADPAYAEAVKQTGLPTAFIDAGGEDVAMQSAAEMRELADKYRDLLTGE